MYREKFYQIHVAERQLLRPLNNLNVWLVSGCIFKSLHVEIISFELKH